MFGRLHHKLTTGLAIMEQMINNFNMVMMIVPNASIGGRL
jgi:hypothetical protein